MSDLDGFRLDLTRQEVAWLAQLVDVLWGELPADVVIALDPEIVDACREIHEQLNHSGD